MRIYLGLGRFIVNAQLVSENFYTAWVCLSNGDYIKRYKRRDFVDFEVDKAKEYRIKPILEYSVKPISKRVHFWNRLVSILKRIWVTLVRPIGSDNESPKE